MNSKPDKRLSHSLKKNVNGKGLFAQIYLLLNVIMMAIMSNHYNKGNQHNKKPDSDRASCRIAIRCKQSDKIKLETAANDAGLTLSQYILKLSLKT